MQNHCGKKGLVIMKYKNNTQRYIPPQIIASCSDTPERSAWLRQLPNALQEIEHRWSLTIGTPYEDDVNNSWVAPVTCNDGTPAVLKLGIPSIWSKHEADGLRFWDGDPTVRLFKEDSEFGAILIERCEPGTRLRNCSDLEQDEVIAQLLRRLWRTPSTPYPFRPLSVLTAYQSSETMDQIERHPDKELIQMGLHLFNTGLPRSAPAEVLLATDLHVGNVLRAQREPWLVIDTMPFIGDPAYDATPHLFESRDRFLSDPIGMTRRFAGLLGVDPERVRLWAFARAAAKANLSWWTDDERLTIIRALAPKELPL
jgi:streptomycin 6-kinase